MEKIINIIRPKLKRTDSISNYMYINNYCKKSKTNKSKNKSVKNNVKK